MRKYEKWLQDVEAAAKEVIKYLGDIDYKEDVYEEALAHEMRLRKIPYERQRNFELMYRGYTIGNGRVDFIVNPFWATQGDENVLEIKANKSIDKSHVRQAQVYMISLNISRGAVLTFHPEIEGGGVLIEEIKMPDMKLLDRSVKKPKTKGSGSLPPIMEKAIKDVHKYLGTEFVYREGTNLTNYTKAIGVELRLNGIDFSNGTYPIIYKGQHVDDLYFPFVFPDRSALDVGLYKKPEQVDEEKKYYKYYAKLFGIKKMYLGLLPQKEDQEVVFLKI